MLIELKQTFSCQNTLFYKGIKLFWTLHNNKKRKKEGNVLCARFTVNSFQSNGWLALSRHKSWINK